MQPIPKLFLSTFLTSLFNLTSAQNVAKLPFSERTGIKGITACLGYPKLGSGFMDPEIMLMHPRVNPGQPADFYNSQNARITAGSRISLLFRTELIIAPFRLSAKAWKRGMEWGNGILIQGTRGKLFFSEENQYPDNDLLIRNKSFTYNFSQITFQSTMYYNQLITGGSMAFIGIGGGIGLPMVTYVYQNVSSEIYHDYLGNGNYQTTERYSGKPEYMNGELYNTIVHASAGLKVHLSCRLNLHAEYSLMLTHHHLATGFALPDFRRGFLFGFRYKFNKPEDIPEGEDGKKNTPFY